MQISRVLTGGIALLAVTGGGVLMSTSAEAASYPCSKNQTLQVGNDNSCVKAMQTYLNGYINARLTLDGDFGAKTDTAVKAFQKLMKLSQDGVVGTHTRDAVCSHTGIPVNSGATHAQIVAAADIVIPMCEGWGYHFD